MKYLVVKGWLGFGDRLQVLKMAVKFAIDNDLQIYVDWTDSMWSHSRESFYSYFKLEKIYELESLSDIPVNSTYYPSFWTKNIMKPLSEEILKENFKDIDIGIPVNTIKADVIVLSSIGRRTVFNDNTFFGNVFRVIHPEIINEVKQRQQQYSLSKSLGVHIRGTDRIKKSRREHPVQSIVVQAFGYKILPMIVVSDDIKSYEIWKRFYPQSTLMSSLIHASVKGNHNSTKDELSISKHQFNINTLVDFFTLMSCQQILSTYRDSRFFQEARNLHPFISLILQ
jgi:hypothetical protein